MRSEWGLSVRAALAVTIVCLSGLAAAPAKSNEAAELAGWWLAIDKTFQPLWETGEITVLEEFLIVSADGAVEDRLMRVDRNAGRALYCQITHSTICSDAPLLAAARLAVEGGRLRVLSRTETAIPLDSPTADLIIRGLAITATPEWTFAFEEDGGRLVLTSATTGSARILVKVEPDRLRRLHAGFVVADAFGRPRKDFRPSAFTNWRCYLARATAEDPAFEPLDGAEYSQPSFLEDYLRVTSYIHALSHLEHRPTADETDPERRKLIHLETEELLVERFDDIAAPLTKDDMKRSMIRRAFAIDRAGGMPAAEANAEAAELAKAFEVSDGKPIEIAVTDAEFSSFTGGSEEDRKRRAEELKSLLCLN